MKKDATRSLESMLNSTNRFFVGALFVFVLSLAAAGGMVLYQSHQTVCELFESKLESSSSSIARELALNEAQVAQALFAKIEASLKYTLSDVSLSLNHASKTVVHGRSCIPSVFGSKVQRELIFSGEKVGEIQGQIRAFNFYEASGFLVLLILTLSLVLKLIKNSLLLTINTQIVKPLEALSQQKELDTENLPREVLRIAKNLEEFRKSVVFRAEASMELEHAKKLSGMANQVAHDLRSPLEVLNGLKNEIQQLPEEARHRFQLSILRVEEITYNLLQKHKENFQGRKASVHLLSLIVNVINVKRIERNDRSDIELNHISSQLSYGAFSFLESGIFKSILSNLINNGMEAIGEDKGKVTLSLTSSGEFNLIQVTDTGGGISIDLQSKVFQEGFTTKANGHGLGLYHARREIISMGGDLRFKTSNSGTTFIIQLPQACKNESWLEQLNLSPYQRVIILDDDPTFHQLWSQKLTSVLIEHVYSVQDMLLRFPILDEKTFFLSDFELMDKKLNGIDIVVHLDHVKHSLLVTARDEDPMVIDKCKQYGLKLLPKALIHHLPVVHGRKEKFVVLIDDDRLTRLNWAARCKKDLKPFLAFESIEAFLAKCSGIDLDSRIFIDSELGDGKKGEIESEILHKMGFTQLFLATGYQKEDIVKPDWIRGVYSKSPDVC